MVSLIVEDDFVSRLAIQKRLEAHGEVHIAVNGSEAVDAVALRLSEGQTYDLICLDIMMPEMDGREALRRIRAAEADAGYPVGRGAKVIMTTALDDAENVIGAFREEADGYLVKPIESNALAEQLAKLGLG